MTDIPGLDARAAAWILSTECPFCPVCGCLPGLVISLAQACCDNEDCRAFMWNPMRTRAENLADESTVDLTGLSGVPYPAPAPKEG